MSKMVYKGYLPRIEYSEEDDCFVGHIVGINDVVSFHADTVSGLHSAFQDAVDDYLEACDKVGRQPHRPYSGKIFIRVTPEIHAYAALKAASHGKSLNAWATELLASGE